MLKYEELNSTLKMQLSKVLKFIGLQLSDDDIKTIVTETSIENMRRLVKETANLPGWLKPTSDDPKSAKVRSGGTDQIDKIMNYSTQKYINDVWKEMNGQVS